MTPKQIKKLRGETPRQQVADYVNSYIREYTQCKTVALSHRSIEKWEDGTRSIPPWYVYFLKKMVEGC